VGLHRANGGFEAAGINRGLKASGKPDLSLLLAQEGPSAPAASPNRVRAACVDLCAGAPAEGAGLCRARAHQLSGRQMLHRRARPDRQPCRRHRGRSGAAKLNVKPEQVHDLLHRRDACPIPDRHLRRGFDPLVAALGPGGGRVPPPPAHPHHPIWPCKQIALEADLGGQRWRIGGMAKGSGNDPPRTWPPCWPNAKVAMPGFRRHLAGHGGPGGARLLQTRSRWNGDTSNQRLLPGLCSRPPLNPELYPALEAGLTACRNTWQGVVP